MESLCGSCTNVRKIVSGTGSVFWLCQLSQTDVRFPKYPPQPVIQCAGYQAGPLSRQTFALDLVPGSFAVCRLDAEARIPEWARGSHASITRTPHELSIVCRQEHVPAGVRNVSGWRCLQVAGPLELSMVGVIAALSSVMAAAGVSVFVVSTFDTDYLLVKDSDLQEAVRALVAAGHPVSVFDANKED